MASILQDWVQALGLRHQGVLVSAVRGCDDAPKGDPAKRFVRYYRGMILNAFCRDAEKAATFICTTSEEILNTYFRTFRKDADHYPIHYVMHILHAIEIIGYKHPDAAVRAQWGGYYESFCRGLHLNVETEEQLDQRLNADEITFGATDRA